MSSQSRAIVLSKENFGEADQYVEFLSEQWGLITLLAKSARKSKRRYAGGLDLFCHDDIFVRGNPRERGYLVELSVTNSFLGIRESFERLTAAGKIAQWIRKLPEPGTSVPLVFSLLGQTLALIEKESNEQRLDLYCLLFKIKLLTLVGLKPQIESCVRCAEEISPEAEPVFDISAGGTLCGRCAPKTSIGEGLLSMPRETRKFLSHADAIKPSQWSQMPASFQRSQELHRLITQFGSFHTHVRLPL